MTMPEAAMNKESLLAPHKTDIWMSGEFLTMDPIAGVADTAEQLAHQQLRPGIFRPHHITREPAKIPDELSARFS